MAFTYCNGTYDLFAANPRCRQPPLAALLALTSLVGAVALIVVARKLFKEPETSGNQYKGA
jgi:hypothetical protein